MHLHIHTDGGSRGNPGKSAIGFVIQDEHEKILYEEGRYIGITTNNVAEYTALLESMKKAHELTKEHNVEKISYLLDSNLIVQQMNGKFKIKAQHLMPIVAEIKKLQISLPPITYRHVRREFNKKADALVNQALDAQKD